MNPRPNPHPNKEQLTDEQILKTPLGLVFFALGQELLNCDGTKDEETQLELYTKIDAVYDSLTKMWPHSSALVIKAMQNVARGGDNASPNNGGFPLEWIDKHTPSSNTRH